MLAILLTADSAFPHIALYLRIALNTLAEPLLPDIPCDGFEFADTFAQGTPFDVPWLI